MSCRQMEAIGEIFEKKRTKQRVKQRVLNVWQLAGFFWQFSIFNVLVSEGIRCVLAAVHLPFGSQRKRLVSHISPQNQKMKKRKGSRIPFFILKIENRKMGNS